MSQVSPLLAQSVHLRTAIGKPPVCHSQTLTDNSDKPEDFHLFYTHAYTPSKQTFDTQGGGESYLFHPVYTHINYSDVVSYFLQVVTIVVFTLSSSHL